MINVEELYATHSFTRSGYDHLAEFLKSQCTFITSQVISRDQMVDIAFDVRRVDLDYDISPLLSLFQQIVESTPESEFSNRYKINNGGFHMFFDNHDGAFFAATLDDMILFHCNLKLNCEEYGVMLAASSKEDIDTIITTARIIV